MAGRDLQPFLGRTDLPVRLIFSPNRSPAFPSEGSAAVTLFTSLHGNPVCPQSLSEKPPGQGTGPTGKTANLRFVVGRVPSHGAASEFSDGLLEQRGGVGHAVGGKVDPGEAAQHPLQPDGRTRARRPRGENGSMTASSSAHGTASSMPARNFSRRVGFFFAMNSAPAKLPLLFHAPQPAHLLHARRQPFRRSAIKSAVL